jgi:hypothetical protein
LLIGWVEEVGLSTEFSCSLWLKTVIYEVEGVNLNLLLSFCEISQRRVQNCVNAVVGVRIQGMFLRAETEYMCQRSY